MKRIKTTIKLIINRFLHYAKEFTEITTLHGVKYMSMSNLHFSEIFLWVTVFMVSVYGASTLIANSWQRYNENPTVVAIQKNYKEWNVTFPAATFCFIDNLDVERARKFIAETWNVKPTKKDEEMDEDTEEMIPEEEDIPSFDEPEDVEYSNINETSSANETEHVSDEDMIEGEDGVKISKYRYYITFLRYLVNQTYENMDLFKQYIGDDTLKGIDITETIFKVIKEHTMTSTFYTKDFHNRDFYLTPTEMGMCYVHGGKLADYITLTGSPRIRENFELPTCNYVNTLCYARTEGTPSDIRYYVHSPYEIPDISSKFFPVRGRMDRDVSFRILETTVSPEIYDLSPSQRHCRFFDESTESHLMVYSFNLCRMQCRKEIAFRLCGCAPYFYTKEDHIPVCGVKGLVCLSQYAEMLIALRTDSGKKLRCDCLPQCIDNKYTVDKEIVRQWMFPVPYDIRFRWAVEKFSKIRLRRDVIFTFDDLVVSFGGTAAFFLGCSVLSFVEIVYFFTLRLFWFITASLRNKVRRKNSGTSPCTLYNMETAKSKCINL